MSTAEQYDRGFHDDMWRCRKVGEPIMITKHVEI